MKDTTPDKYQFPVLPKEDKENPSYILVEIKVDIPSDIEVEDDFIDDATVSFLILKSNLCIVAFKKKAGDWFKLAGDSRGPEIVKKYNMKNCSIPSSYAGLAYSLEKAKLGTHAFVLAIHSLASFKVSSSKK